jgi:hypothetical protein
MLVPGCDQAPLAEEGDPPLDQRDDQDDEEEAAWSRIATEEEFDNSLKIPPKKLNHWGQKFVFYLSTQTDKDKRYLTNDSLDNFLSLNLYIHNRICHNYKGPMFIVCHKYLGLAKK